MALAAINLFFVLEGVVNRSPGHRTRIKPNISHIRDSRHPLAAFRTLEINSINIRTVKVNLARFVRWQIIKLELPPPSYVNSGEFQRFLVRQMFCPGFQHPER